MKLKNNLLFGLYTMIIGIITGSIIWGFLKLMNLGIKFLWEDLPNKFDYKYYTLVVCLIGGIFIGLWKKYFGDFPEDLNAVIKKVKTNKRYSYNNFFASLGSALFPLVIGASIGPEAGLTGLIAGLCTWIGDKLKHFFKEVSELTNIGIQATLGTIFKSPMFGFVEPIENEDDIVLPKTAKNILYFIAILSSFGIFILLNHLFNGDKQSSTLIASFDNLNYFYIVLLIIIGIVLGNIYSISHIVISKIFKPLKNTIVIRCIIGGLALGICGLLLPLAMFSGEEQVSIIINDGVEIGIIILVLTSIFKIILTNICIESGLKGGHFFPMIFSGISMGYAFSLIFNIDSVIAMAVLTAAFLANIMKKPIAVVLLLMIIFPVNLIPIMLASAFIACIFRKEYKKAC